jgi:hypothetical protein
MDKKRGYDDFNYKHFFDFIVDLDNSDCSSEKSEDSVNFTDLDIKDDNSDDTNISDDTNNSDEFEEQYKKIEKYLYDISGKLFIKNNQFDRELQFAPAIGLSKEYFWLESENNYPNLTLDNIYGLNIFSELDEVIEKWNLPDKLDITSNDE